jgi:hypothetical protein
LRTDNVGGAELSAAVDDHRHAGPDSAGVENARDEGLRLRALRANADYAVVARNTFGADQDVVVARVDFVTGGMTHRDVTTACAVKQRNVAHAGVLVTSGIVHQHGRAYGGVANARSVRKEACFANPDVAAALRIV